MRAHLPLFQRKQGLLTVELLTVEGEAVPMDPKPDPEAVGSREEGVRASSWAASIADLRCDNQVV